MYRLPFLASSLLSLCWDLPTTSFPRGAHCNNQSFIGLPKADTVVELTILQKHARALMQPLVSLDASGYALLTSSFVRPTHTGLMQYFCKLYKPKLLNSSVLHALIKKLTSLESFMYLQKLKDRVALPNRVWCVWPFRLLPGYWGSEVLRILTSLFEKTRKAYYLLMSM